jgi:hypothetical protein
VIKLQRILLLPYAVIAAAIFYLALATLGIDNFIVTLNGALIGALAAITVTYSRVIRSWFWGDTPTDGVSMFGLFFMLLWAMVGLSVFSSIYIRAANLPQTSLLTTAIVRYVLIICAWGLINSIDYGEAWFYGRDRKYFYSGLVVGAIVGAIIIYVQRYQVLA